jgi:hypothetical protein
MTRATAVYVIAIGPARREALSPAMGHRGSAGLGASMSGERGQPTCDTTSDRAQGCRPYRWSLEAESEGRRAFSEGDELLLSARQGKQLVRVTHVLGWERFRLRGLRRSSFSALSHSLILSR